MIPRFLRRFMTLLQWRFTARLQAWVRGYRVPRVQAWRVPGTVCLYLWAQDEILVPHAVLEAGFRANATAIHGLLAKCMSPARRTLWNSLGLVLS